MFCYSGSTEPTNLVFVCGPWVAICIWKEIKKSQIFGMSERKVSKCTLSIPPYFSVHV